MVFVLDGKVWKEYDASYEGALITRLPERVFEGDRCPPPWFRSAGEKMLRENANRRSDQIQYGHEDGEPTPGFPRDKD